MSTKKKNNVNIVLVDDHPIIREGIKQVVEKADDLKVCGGASDASEAMVLINKHKPDIVIVDISLGGSINGIDLVRSIRERFPEVYTLMLSMHEESLYAERAIRAGARGYIMKEVAPKNIIDAIRTVLKGDLYISDILSKKIIDKLIHGSVDTDGLSIDTLTDREFEIFQLIGNGFSTKEIAKKLNLSIYTVESHRRNIRTKMKLNNSAELTKHAIQWIIMQEK
ncbi:MAG: response regulator transcription factor [Spirochaetota bacterium]|nr:response regulator transcription factor [Spirochaetota bacterium]